MYEELGAYIRDKRRGLGLEQGPLALRLGVGQQTVSRWEAGASRPRRGTLAQVAAVLGGTEDELVTLGGYRGFELEGNLPIAARPVTLPFHELPPDAFEHCIADVMAVMFPNAHVSRFGGPGETQDGIDILAVTNGRRTATGQCKRHKTFGKEKVKTAIAAVREPAPKNFLFLSRTTATAAARKEAETHRDQGWELWDGEDLSRFLRLELDAAAAVRLVSRYFPAHVLPFLGVEGPGAFLLPEEAFASASSVFNHEGNLVGRTTEVETLAAAGFGTEWNVAFLVAPGGMGKTHVLRAVAESAPKRTQLRVLPGSARPTAADVAMLPTGALTILIDDAHELDDVAAVATSIWRRNPNARVVVATRPYALPRIREALIHATLLPADPVMVHLGDLDPEEAEALARQSLGDKAFQPVVSRLAHLTADSPLATVIGGGLIRDGKLNPLALEQDSQVRQRILGLFATAMAQDPDAYDPPTRRAVLDAVAALQPFRADDESAQDALTRIVGKAQHEVAKHLRSLEDAGLLRRRGHSLRIVPDLLGDTLLADAIFDGTNPLGTGYLAAIVPVVSGASLEHLFVNASRVDWQARNADGDTPNLVDDLWEAFAARLRSCDIVDRATLAEVLAKVAYFQPQRAVQLTRWLIDNPTDVVSEHNSPFRRLLDANYSMVREALPPVLRAAAMTGETLPEALAQLWELAQDDNRPTNQHPQHPMRALTDLASYSFTKNTWFHERIIDVASAWFAKADKVSPFKVLEAMLATDVRETSMRGRTVLFRRLPIDPTRVAMLRHRVIDLAFSELESVDLRRAGAAAETLKSAVQMPLPADNAGGHDWTPDILATIQRIRERVAAGSLDPAVVVGLRKALYWHDAYGSGATHEAAADAVDVMSADVDNDLALALHDGWANLMRDRGDDYEAMEEKRDILITRVVAALEPRSDTTVADLLSARLLADRQVHGQTAGYPGPLLEALIFARPAVGRAIVEIVRRDGPASPLNAVLPIVLAALVAADPEVGLEHALPLLSESSQEHRIAAAQALGTNRGLRPLAAGELSILMNLAADTHAEIRLHMAHGARSIAHDDPGAATRILAVLRFGDSEAVADAFFLGFGMNRGLSWSNFSDDDIVPIDADLVALATLNPYSVQAALASRSKTQPAEVVEVLKRRIEFTESTGGSLNYEALPHHWDAKLQVHETPEYAACLEGILDWMANADDSYIRGHEGAELFAAVAHGYGEQALAVLTRGLAHGEPAMVDVVLNVIEAAPRTLIWDSPEFVTTVLEACARIDNLTQQRAVSAFRAAARTSWGVALLGEAFPHSLAQRDRCREVAQTLSPGSSAWQMYTDLADIAEQDIERQTYPEPQPDGRHW